MLRDHLNGDKKIKYLSRTITDEQIVVLANESRNSIISDVKQAKFYSVISDSRTHISHVDQLANLVRYVHVDYGQRTVALPESFLQFIDVHNAEAA